MSERMKRLLTRPWIIHMVSLIGMIGLACPMYRMRAGSSVGLVRYGLDSLGLAFRLPGFSIAMFLPIPFLDVLATFVIWGLAIWPLFHADRRRGLILSYVVLVPLWGLYALGWTFAHMWAGH